MRQSVVVEGNSWPASDSFYYSRLNVFSFWLSRDLIIIVFVFFFFFIATARAEKAAPKAQPAKRSSAPLGERERAIGYGKEWVWERKNKRGTYVMERKKCEWNREKERECVCEWNREKERESVWVKQRERERERVCEWNREKERESVWVKQREREKVWEYGKEK